jgi:hypothetical protein
MHVQAEGERRGADQENGFGAAPGLGAPVRSAGRWRRRHAVTSEMGWDAYIIMEFSRSCRAFYVRQKPLTN